MAKKKKVVKKEKIKEQVKPESKKAEKVDKSKKNL